jgi:hypothetical protein
MMGTKAGVGVSWKRNPAKAGKEAAEMALKKAGIDAPNFVFLFATVGYAQDILLESVRKVTGRAPLCGCSAEGTIAQGIGDESNFSVVVMTIVSDEFGFIHGVAENLQNDPAGAGRTIAKSIKPQISAQTMGLFLFPDFTINFDRFIGGLDKALNHDRFLPILGAAASDNLQFSKSYQYIDDKILNDAVSWVLLSGQGKVIWTVMHGCIPIGNERKITRSKGNLIYQIDGKRADEVIAEYLSSDTIKNWGRSKKIAELCLGFKSMNPLKPEDDYIIRAILGGRDEASGAIAIPTEVCEGASVWMTRRDLDKIVTSFNCIADDILRQLGSRPAKLVLHFECAGRGKIILREQQKMSLLKGLQQKIGVDTPWVGFYCYGEIAPVGERNFFHNFTSIVTAIQ